MRHLRNLLTAWLILTLGACAGTPWEPVAPRDRGDAPAPAEEDRGAQVGAQLRVSPNDHREYRHLTLANDLDVLLVSDAETDKAAASLTVFRGSYHEPPEYPGLAHFLEHMLFIATEKYPEVDAYQTFVSRHGGSSNAYTAGDHTNYFFDISPDRFREAMDRFAQFFISPLLDGDYVNRERNAVHSEFQLQRKDDGWRGSAVLGEVMNPAHPESRFSIGSLETLDDGVREALVAFFEQNYSADQMVLVALSDEPLDAMAEWVVPMFTEIENRELGPDPVDTPMFLDSDLPARVSYRTVKEGYTVAYNFPVPGVKPRYREKPAQYVANLLGHEGRGSLYQRLSREGWIDGLSAGTRSFDRRNSVLRVKMQLTDRGYANLDAVTALLFDYVALLEENPPDAWRYEEQARIAELGFRYQEPTSAGSFVYRLAPRFKDYPPEDVLAAPYLMTRFDPGLIDTYIDLLTPENLVMEVAGPDVPAERTERWFGVPYSIVPGPPDRAAVEHAELALPPPNPYLPEELEVLPHEEDPPELSVARPGLTLWTDRDTGFDTPRANLYLSLGVPEGFSSPTDVAMARLYERVVEDALSEAVYPAYLAGLSYRLAVDGYGFEVAVSGYSDKQLELLATVLDALAGAELDPDRVATLRDELLRDWRNYRDERPYTQAVDALGQLLLSSRWPPETLAGALAGVSAEDLAAWRDRRLEKLHVLGLNHGNVPVESAWALASVLQEHLPLGAFRRRAPRVVEVDGARRYPLDIAHDDSVMVLYLQDPDAQVTSRATSALAARLLHQAYFSRLRTEEQLGYVVSVSNRTLRDRGGLAFIVQSPVASAAALEKATRAFLEERIATVADMSAERFASYKRGLVARLTERDKTLHERGRRLWSNLELGITSFDLRERIARAVSGLDKAAMLAYLNRLADRFETQRLLVYSSGRFENAPSQGTTVEDVRAFKAIRDGATGAP